MKTGSSAPRVWLNPVAVWEFLDRLDISQNQLARLAGISPGHLSLLMNGMRIPAPKVRRQLMRTLGVDDFRRLFIMKRPASVGEKAERSGAIDTSAMEALRPGGHGPTCGGCRWPLGNY